MSPNSQELVFKHISKGKGPYKLVSTGRSICYSCIWDAARRDLKNIGIDPCKFGLYSLRSGGATTAANNGVNDGVLQGHGNWKFVGAVNTYIHDSIERRLSVSISF